MPTPRLLGVCSNFPTDFWVQLFKCTLAMCRRSRKGLSTPEEMYSAPLSTEDTPVASMKLAARERKCGSNCKSLRNLRSSSHCERWCDRDGRNNAQLHQTQLFLRLQLQPTTFTTTTAANTFTTTTTTNTFLLQPLLTPLQLHPTQQLLHMRVPMCQAWSGSQKLQA